MRASLRNSIPDGATSTIQADPESLFASAVRAGADMQMDWMSLYAHMTGPFERLYCIEKALAHNPGSEAARHQLALLAERR
jgi:hypothetical protein